MKGDIDGLVQQLSVIQAPVQAGAYSIAAVVRSLRCVLQHRTIELNHVLSQ